MKASFDKSSPGKAKSSPAVLGLALQGGGSYGAFTKGALKALLESDIITSHKAEIKAVTGTSAGAVNGALLVHGLHDGGPQAAIRNLDNLWNDLGQTTRNAQNLTPFFNMFTNSAWPNIPRSFLNAAQAMFPPGYARNHIKNTLETHIKDWSKLQNGPVTLYVNATKEDPVTKQRSHYVFTGQELTSEAITASTALHDLGAQNINGINFYDGAYWRNPCFSDIKKEGVTDLLAITIQALPDHPVMPVHHDDLRAHHTMPGHKVMTWETHHHLDWIAQNNKNLNLHVISLDVDDSWDETSRMNSDPRWLAQLETMGYDAATKWINDHGAKLGQQSSYRKPCHKQQQTGCHCTPSTPC